MVTTLAIPPPPLLFQIAAVFADDLVVTIGVGRGDALKWALFSVGHRIFTVGAPEDVA